jgi:membrane associated rhomboid family serine protease
MSETRKKADSSLAFGMTGCREAREEDSGVSAILGSEESRERMAYSDRSYARPYIGVPGLPTAIKWLIISNVAVFLAEWFSPSLAAVCMQYFALTPILVVHGYVWQLATYMFLHGGIWHILFNMLALWMFGADIEQTWGTRRFLKFYFFCGIGAGLC